MLARSWTFLLFEVFFFHDIHKKQRRSLSKSGYKIQKICGGKMYSRTRTFGAEVHNSNIRVTRWHKKYKILNYIERHNFWSSDLLTKSNRTTLQSYKERTFGTTCKFLIVVCRAAQFSKSWAWPKCYFLHPFLDLVLVSNNHERGQDPGVLPYISHIGMYGPKGRVLGSFRSENTLPIFKISLKLASLTCPPIFMYMYTYQ